jgi:hypothetical protein
MSRIITRRQSLASLKASAHRAGVIGAGIFFGIIAAILICGAGWLILVTF